MTAPLPLIMAGTLADRFDEFHRNNPAVYDALVRLAREWVAATNGRKVGIGALYEVARWQIAIATGDGDFKLNNDFRAFYARKLMAENTDLDGLFELRRSQADDQYPRSAA